MTQTVQTNFLDVMIGIDRAVEMPHDDVALLRPFLPRRAEVAKSRPQPREVAAVALPLGGHAGLADEDPEDAGNLVGGLPVAVVGRNEPLAALGSEEQRLVLRARRRRGLVPAEQFDDVGRQGADPFDLAGLAPAEVDDARLQVEGAPRQVADVRVVERAAQPQRDPAADIQRGEAPKAGYLIHGERAAAVQPGVTDHLLVRAGKVGPRPELVEILHANGPLEEGADAGNLRVVGAGREVGDLLPEGRELGRADLRDLSAGADEAAELVQRDGVIMQGTGGQRSGLTRLHAHPHGGQELAQHVAIAQFLGDLDGRLPVAVDGFAAVVPSLLDVAAGHGFAAHKACLSGVPTNPPVLGGGEAWRPLVTRGRPFGGVDLAHYGVSLWRTGRNVAIAGKNSTVRVMSSTHASGVFSSHTETGIESGESHDSLRNQSELPICDGNGSALGIPNKASTNDGPHYVPHYGRIGRPAPVSTYFIQGVRGGPVKIGRAVNIRSRLKSLQTSHHERLRVLLTLPGDHEPSLHRRFADARLNGEWFRPVPEIIQFLAEHGVNLAGLPADLPLADSADEAVTLLRDAYRPDQVLSRDDGDERPVHCDLHSLLLAFVTDGDEDLASDYETRHDGACDCEGCSIELAVAGLQSVPLRAAFWTPETATLNLVADAPRSKTQMVGAALGLMLAADGLDGIAITATAAFVGAAGGIVCVDPRGLWLRTVGLHSEQRRMAAARVAARVEESLRLPPCSILIPDLSDLPRWPSSIGGVA